MTMKTALTLLNDVATAMQCACLRDLPDFETTGAKDYRGKVIPPRRPSLFDLDGVEVFQQTWGSTALGFGGLGGAAMTSANTVIVTGPDGAKAVYFGSGFAYLIRRPNGQFFNDAQHHRMYDRSGAKSRYEEKTTTTQP